MYREHVTNVSSIIFSHPNVKENIELYESLKIKVPQHKNIYVQDYNDGSICVVNNKPRRIQIYYYCDEYAAY
jgi:hypothetical protein